MIATTRKYAVWIPVNVVVVLAALAMLVLSLAAVAGMFLVGLLLVIAHHAVALAYRAAARLLVGIDVAKEGWDDAMEWMKRATTKAPALTLGVADRLAGTRAVEQ